MRVDKSIITFLVWIIWCSVSIECQGHGCESLSHRTGVDIQCEHPRTKESLDCQNSKVPIGTIAHYKCEHFFETNEGEVQGGQMRCDNKGKWTPDRPFRVFSCHMDCGKSFPEGSNTKWPWHVGIFGINSSASHLRSYCGGTLINPFSDGYLILTSADCLVNSNFVVENMEVRMGLFTLQTNRHYRGGSDETFSVKKVVTSRDARSLALLQLHREPILSKNILPACLNGNVDFSKHQLREFNYGQIVGFGDVGKLNTLRNISVHITSPSQCNQDPRLTKTSICAENLEGRNICPGDLGSGLVFPNYSRNAIRHFLQGVLVERISNCKRHVVFTKVRDNIDWFKETALQLQNEQKNVNIFSEMPKETPLLQLRLKPIGCQLPNGCSQVSNSKHSNTPIENPSSTTNLRDYEAAGIEWHNLYRRKHGVPPVSFSAGLSKIAQIDADRSIGTNRFKFEDVTNWDAISGGNLSSKRVVEEAIKDWYKSSSNYDWNNPKVLPFTHIVWRSTTEIGIGVSRKGDKQVVVIKYNQPDVTSSEEQRSFKENIPRPITLN